MNEEARIVELEMRVADLERKVDTLMRQLDLPYAKSINAPGQSEIEDLLRKGKKIDAIRVYREATGVGLKEAKDQIDELDRKLKGK